MLIKINDGPDRPSTACQVPAKHTQRTAEARFTDSPVKRIQPRAQYG